MGGTGTKVGNTSRTESNKSRLNERGRRVKRRASSEGCVVMSFLIKDLSEIWGSYYEFELGFSSTSEVRLVCTC